MSVTLSRAQIRKQMRAQRAQLSPVERDAAASQVASFICSSAVFRRSHSIACYFAHNGELDMTPVMQCIWNRGKRCYLPVLGPINSRRLWFAPYHQEDALLLNRYGIPEPRTNYRDHVRPWALDLILMPVVAFDDAGNRLGMGGGFYDRTFSFLQHRNHWRKPHLVGTAYDFQQVDSLERRPWDVPVHNIVSNKGFHLER